MERVPGKRGLHKENVDLRRIFNARIFGEAAKERRIGEVVLRDMADDADDEERKELLSVFHKNPQKLKKLVDVFNAFIENNKKGPSRHEKRRSSSSLNVSSSHKSAASAVYTSAGEIDKSVTVESVTEKLEEWLPLKIDGNVLNERLENCKKASFIETFSLRLSTEEKQCICLVCKQPLGLPKKNMKDKTKLSISNATRHIAG